MSTSEQKERPRHVLSPETGRQLVGNVVEIGLLPGKMVVDGLKKYYDHIAERKQLSADEVLEQKYSSFKAFMTSEDKDSTYQEVFDIDSEQAEQAYFDFSRKLMIEHGIALELADEQGQVPIPNGNGHRLFVHPQNDGNYFLEGYIETVGHPTSN